MEQETTQETKARSASQDETIEAVSPLVTPSQAEAEDPPAASETEPTRVPRRSAPIPYVYAIGRIEARFPRLSVEKEFAQAAGRAVTAAQTDQQVFYNVLSKPESRYLARQLCWVLTIQGLETYIVLARAIPRITIGWSRPSAPDRSPLDIDVVIGTRGPIAPPELCNGLMVPIVVFDQIYSFDRDALMKAIPRPEKMSDKQFKSAAGRGVRSGPADDR